MQKPRPHFVKFVV